MLQAAGKLLPIVRFACISGPVSAAAPASTTYTVHNTFSVLRKKHL